MGRAVFYWMNIMKKSILILFVLLVIAGCSAVSGLAKADTFQFTPPTEIRVYTQGDLGGAYTFEAFTPEMRGGYVVILRETATGPIIHWSPTFPDNGSTDTIIWDNPPVGTWYISLVALINSSVEGGVDSDESNQTVETIGPGEPVQVIIKPEAATEFRKVP